MTDHFKQVQYELLGHLYSRNFLHNISTSDIGIGHIDVNYTNERFREVWQITSEKTCIYKMLNGISVPKLF
jgi:hypothetical protein